MRLSSLSRSAHDVRSSLTAIKEGISLVIDGTLGKINKKQKHVLKIAQEEIFQVVSVMDNLSKLKKKGRLK